MKLTRNSFRLLYTLLIGLYLVNLFCDDLSAEISDSQAVYNQSEVFCLQAENCHQAVLNQTGTSLIANVSVIIYKVDQDYKNLKQLERSLEADQSSIAIEKFLNSARTFLESCIESLEKLKFGGDDSPTKENVFLPFNLFNAIGKIAVNGLIGSFLPYKYKQNAVKKAIWAALQDEAETYKLIQEYICPGQAGTSACDRKLDMIIAGIAKETTPKFGPPNELLIQKATYSTFFYQISKTQILNNIAADFKEKIPDHAFQVLFDNPEKQKKFRDLQKNNKISPKDLRNLIAAEMAADLTNGRFKSCISSSKNPKQIESCGDKFINSANYKIGKKIARVQIALQLGGEFDGDTQSFRDITKSALNSYDICAIERTTKKGISAEQQQQAATSCAYGSLLLGLKGTAQHELTKRLNVKDNQGKPVYRFSDDTKENLIARSLRDGFRNCELGSLVASSSNLTSSDYRKLDKYNTDQLVTASKDCIASLATETGRTIAAYSVAVDPRVRDAFKGNSEGFIQFIQSVSREDYNRCIVELKKAGAKTKDGMPDIERCTQVVSALGKIRLTSSVIEDEISKQLDVLVDNLSKVGEKKKQITSIVLANFKNCTDKISEDLLRRVASGITETELQIEAKITECGKEAISSTAFHLAPIVAEGELKGRSDLKEFEISLSFEEATDLQTKVKECFSSHLRNVHDLGTLGEVAPGLADVCQTVAVEILAPAIIGKVFWQITDQTEGYEPSRNRKAMEKTLEIVKLMEVPQIIQDMTQPGTLTLSAERSLVQGKKGPSDSLQGQESSAGTSHAVSQLRLLSESIVKACRYRYSQNCEAEIDVLHSQMKDMVRKSESGVGPQSAELHSALYEKLVRSDLMDSIIVANVSEILKERLSSEIKQYGLESENDLGQLKLALGTLSSQVFLKGAFEAPEGRQILNFVKTKMLTDPFYDPQTDPALMKKITSYFASDTRVNGFVDHLLFGIADPEIDQRKQNGIKTAKRWGWVPGLGHYINGKLEKSDNVHWGKIQNTTEGNAAREILSKWILVPTLTGGQSEQEKAIFDFRALSRPKGGSAHHRQSWDNVTARYRRLIANKKFDEVWKLHEAAVESQITRKIEAAAEGLMH